MFTPTWQAIILGIFQGLTEFLPISSSAHLILVPWLLEWSPLGIIFDVVIHGGTLLAVFLYFRRDWSALTLEFLQLCRRPRLWVSSEDSLLRAILLGTLPAIVVALLLRGWIEQYARTPAVTILTLALFGLLLGWADLRKKGSRPVESATLRDGALIGCAQVLALIPGVSRSGITMIAALLLGFTRADSARFSFLLATPIIALGALNGSLEVLAGEAGDLNWAQLLAGTFTSFLVGFFCIKYLLEYLRTHTFLPFVVYRLALAGAILALWLARS